MIENVHLPPHIQRMVDDRADAICFAALKRASGTLSDAYRGGAPADAARLPAAERVAAYMVTRMPATYVAAHRVLGEVRERLRGCRVESVLDVGGGTGAASLAARHWFPDAAITLLDRDPAFADAALECLPGAALRLDDREGFRILRWPTALAADLAVLSMTILALSPGGSEALVRDLQPGTVLLMALGLVAVHLGIVLNRILRRPKVVGWFEVVQTAAVLLAGFGGAVRMAAASGGTGLLGALALLVGLGLRSFSMAPGLLGEAGRTLAILRDLALEAEVSPTLFSMSVHNSVPGLWSIINGVRAPFSAVAAGSGSFGWGLLEALAAFTADPSAPVLYVYGDDRLPDPWAETAPRGLLHAVALLVGTPAVRRLVMPPEGPAALLPQSLDCLRALRGGASSWQLG